MSITASVRNNRVSARRELTVLHESQNNVCVHTPLTVTSYFSAECKAAIPLEDATVKLSESYKTSLSSGKVYIISFMPIVSFHLHGASRKLQWNSYVLNHQGKQKLF